MTENRHKVLVIGPLPEPAIALFDERDDILVQHVEDFSHENLLAEFTDASGATLRGAKVTADIIEAAPKLKVVSRFGVGYDNVDIPAMNARGAALTVVGDANAVNVAELAIYMMLELAKRGRQHDQAVRGDDWWYKNRFNMTELWRQTLLIVGFGRIGTRVAARCKAFEMDVLVCDPYIDQQLIVDAGCTPVADFRSVLPRVDYLTVHTPRTEETIGMIGASELAQMKPSAILVNCARGGIVDEAALLDALKSGKLVGAGLDVFAQEPPATDNPLFALDNVILTPHMGGTSTEAALRMGMVCVQNVLDAIDDNLNPELVINKEVLERG